MLNQITEEAKDRFKEVINGFTEEISKFRTGRASIKILDGLTVEYYGTPTPINQVATLSVPEPNLIVIQPWDANIIGDIDKALRNSNIDLNPFSDGKVIKLPVPPLDEQRRLEIIKTLKKYTEERKTQIRNIRRDYREMVKKMQDAKDISEDEEKKFYESFQKVVDENIATLDKIGSEKEKHILDD
ncbi:MAG: ribosome recycling factor [Acidobacteriota bacterium]